LHGLIISGIAFLVKEKTFSRLVLFGFLLFSHSGIVLASIFRQRLRQNRLESNSLVILHEGQSFVKPFARSLASSQPEIIEFASFLQTKNWQSLLVDTLVFFLKTDSFQKYRHVIEHKISQGIRCELFLDEISDLNGSVPVAIHFAETSLSPLYQSTKRLIDLLLCLPGIALYCFLHLIFGPIIRYQTGGCSPLFYQERLGKNGKPFQLVKFRTMSAAPLPSDAVNEVSGPAFKIKNDPRIIPIGRFLRRTSLDEVPQFLNVLKGDMSVVGPRPPLTGEVADYEAPIYKRLRVQPGITGYWQVTSRKSTTSFDQIFQDDLYYLSHASLFLDLYIIVMTPIVMLRGEGR
jgi:lipopolysaccharide/colanic/teichoic acid biosynthesis glycosyltransferase